MVRMKRSSQSLTWPSSVWATTELPGNQYPAHGDPFCCWQSIPNSADAEVLDSGVQKAEFVTEE
eukprot:scaffold131539_cov43-Cyclotella_meneghiniana.AAC.6